MKAEQSLQQARGVASDQVAVKEGSSPTNGALHDELIATLASSE